MTHSALVSSTTILLVAQWMSLHAEVPDLKRGEPPVPIALETEQNVPVEVKLEARHFHRNPFEEVTLDAVFTDPEGRQLRVPGFWAGGSAWRIRYASPLSGEHYFRTASSDAADAGLQGVQGLITIRPSSREVQNPLYRHGPLRVAAGRRHLEHADGTPFFWLGDTWWMGLCRRLRWPQEFHTLLNDRLEKGFTVIQIVAGLYPDMPPFDERGLGDGGFPWEEGYARIRPEYFEAADQRLGALVKKGLVPCIVGAWGYFLPWMGVEKAKVHWRYLVARYGAWPVLWCIAGEANLPYYLAEGFPYEAKDQVKGWTEVTRYVRGIDPFHRPITIHPTGLGRLSARGATEDPSLLDIDMLQTPHGEWDAVAPTVRTVREARAAQPVLPVINGEASYEVLFDRIPAEFPRMMFWICLMSGAAGHTYGANGIWQCNRRGEPHGASPHGGSYGTIPWDEAMKLPGSSQVALGKKLLEEYPWHRFTPHPEWVEYAGDPGSGLEGGQWIWFPEGEPARDAPAEKRWFRKTFNLPAASPSGAGAAGGARGARLFMAADDGFTAWLNGEKVASARGWGAVSRSADLSRFLEEGTNVLAVAAENHPEAVPANPAGLIGCLEVRIEGGAPIRIVTDGTWRAAKGEVAGGEAPGLDDSGWVAARALGPNGMSPWGKVGGRRELDVPHAAGIPGELRVIYVPRGEPIIARGLEPGVAYTAVCFDPVSGEKTGLGIVRPEAGGTWTCAPPAGVDHDWVALLDARAPTGGGGAASAARDEEMGWKASGRHGVVAAGKAGAVAAGLGMLEAGGNAADAAAATILALAITDYGSFAIGAEVPILVYSAKSGQVKVLSGMGGAPLDPEAIRWYREHGIPRSGMKNAAVPSAPSAIFLLLELFGTVSFEAAAGPALALLEKGGADWHPKLAATLRKLIETERQAPGGREEKLRAARDRFYKGDIADALEAWYIEKGGFLRKADLAAHITRVEDPVTVSYRGTTVCKCGPWTQGPYLCQTLRLLEAFDLKAMGHGTADYLHACAEALKLALADRDAYYGDPIFADVPLKALLSDEYTKLRVPLIDMRKASREVRPGDPVGLRAIRGPGSYRPGPGGTTTCCVADRWGNVVAATPSGNPPFVEPPGGTTGVTHATRLTSLNTTEGHPNCIEPGKRPRITLTPTLVLKDGKPVLAISVAGGDIQDQTTLNLLLGAVEFRMMPERAVRAPRFSTGHHEDSFDPSPSRTAKALGSLQVPAGTRAEVAADLKARGHEVSVTGKPIGHPIMIFIDPATGEMHAAGDPDAGRHAGAARARP